MSEHVTDDGQTHTTVGPGTDDYVDEDGVHQKGPSYFDLTRMIFTLRVQQQCKLKADEVGERTTREWLYGTNESQHPAVSNAVQYIRRQGRKYASH